MTADVFQTWKRKFCCMCNKILQFNGTNAAGAQWNSQTQIYTTGLGTNFCGRWARIQWDNYIVEEVCMFTASRQAARAYCKCNLRLTVSIMQNIFLFVVLLLRLQVWGRMMNGGRYLGSMTSCSCKKNRGKRAEQGRENGLIWGLQYLFARADLTDHRFPLLHCC